MSYDLTPVNEEAGPFRFGAFSFPVLLEACGYLFACIHNGAKWYCAFGADPRMPEGDEYPRLLSNDGFAVTAEEARIMARVARNFVATGTETRRALVLILHDSTQKPTTPAHDWTPKGLCRG